MIDVEVDLESKVPKIYRPIFLPSADKYRYLVLAGGRGSGKSWAAAMKVVVSMIVHKGFKVLVAREFGSDIDGSASALIKETIEHLGLSAFFDIQKKSVTCKLNGSEIRFRGLAKDRAQGAKSIEGVGLVWIEEAHNISKDTWGTLTPSIRKTGSQIMLSYNPYNETDPIHNKFFVRREDEDISLKILSTIYDNNNPISGKSNASESLWIDERSCKKNDPDRYDHVWLGKCLEFDDASIFSKKIKRYNQDIPNNVDVIGGIDWGYSVDPMACVCGYIRDNSLFISRAFSEVGVEISDWSDWMSEVFTKGTPIYADSSQPGNISHLQSYGWDVRSCRKYSGSVQDGITFLRGLDGIYVHSDISDGVVQEMMSYSWKRNRVTNKILPVPEDKDNHVWDAVRYMVGDYIDMRTNIYDFVEAF